MRGDDSLYTSGRYGAQNPGWHDDDAPHKAKAVRRLVRACGVAPRSVIEVGCGTGGVLLALKDSLDGEGATTVTYDGWDVSAEPLVAARARERDRLRFHLGQPHGPADLVLVLDVVEHVADDVEFLRGLRTLGTAFVFRLPLEDSVWDALHPNRAVERRRQWGHLHRYSRPLALDLLRESGFAVLSEVYDRVPPAIERRRGQTMDLARRTLFRIDPHRAVAWLGGYSLLVCARPI